MAGSAILVGSEELFGANDAILGATGFTMMLSLPLVTALPIAAIAEDAGAPPRYWRTVGYGYLAYVATLLAAGAIGLGTSDDSAVGFALLLGGVATLAAQVAAADSR